jgi:hypothetical protein
MKLHRNLASLVATLAFALSALGAPAPQPAAAAAPVVYCECMTYVQNYVGHIPVLYAKDAGPALRQMGYRESKTPMGINDIVVLQPYFANANATAGHIAFLASYSISNGWVSVILRGANQSKYGWWTDHGCYNVNRVSFSYNNNWGIRFYRR